MALEERILRAQFQAEHGQYIPEDVCLYIENPPNRWTVSTWNDEPLETLPEIEKDLIEEVRWTIGAVCIYASDGLIHEGAVPGERR